MGSLKVRKNSARSFLGFAQHTVSITETSLVYEPIIYGLFVVPIVDYDKILMDSFTLSKEKGRILLRESSKGESSGLRVRLEGSLKTHYDAYLLPANAYSLPTNAYSLLSDTYLLC